MTTLRRDVWRLGTEAAPWHPVLLAYARGVRAMQQWPATDPRSWRYQAAIHGIAGAVPPPGAPWNECQHATWYFLPWHRMYLYRFEQILRSTLPAADRATWALPYWDYGSGAPGNALPPAFRVPTLPDGSANPLFVAARRKLVNDGNPLPTVVTDASAALAETAFTENGFGGSTGFGGPRTGWAHQGPAFGALEAQPHGPVHVWVGGAGGLMSDPNTAALDPIFWLHHANVDRLWELWRVGGGAEPAEAAWRNRRFALRDAAGAAAVLRPREVLDTVGQLDYTYDSLPVDAAVDVAAPDGSATGRRDAVSARPRPLLVGAGEETVELGPQGAETQVGIAALAEPGLAADAEPARVYLNLADIEGRATPGVVYGVYLNLPGAGPDPEHLAGVVSFFGLELTTSAGAAESEQAVHGMRYSFDVTALVDRLRARGAWDPATLRVALLPADGSDEPALAAADAPGPVRIGTVSVYQG